MTTIKMASTYFKTCRDGASSLMPTTSKARRGQTLQPENKPSVSNEMQRGAENTCKEHAHQHLNKKSRTVKACAAEAASAKTAILRERDATIIT